MVSIIITTYKESETLSRAIQSILDQIKKDYEILVVGPDRETENIVQGFSAEYPEVKYLKDAGEGKPAALVKAFTHARGEILILTDGDVLIGERSLSHLLESFKEPQIGAVSGRPISLNPRNNLWGYWSHFLTFAAHQMRMKSKKFPCSGYLYAFRNNIISQLSKNLLAEDGVITEEIRSRGYGVVYASKAVVLVKYPDNLNDWLKQKIRSTGGYAQKSEIIRRTRTFKQELKSGLVLFFTYPKTIKEFFWTFLLYLTRIYLWLAIFWNIRIKNKKFSDLWQRVESTKRWHQN